MNKLLIVVFALIVAYPSFSQKNEELIDGTIGVIGNKVILHSEIESQLVQAKQEGYDLGENSRCLIYEQVMFQSLLMYQAEVDSLEISNPVG